jgi:tRNA (cmo5U34)-methyltransferase
MIELAKARLKSLASRVKFVIGDFRKLQELAPGAGTADVVFSAYALHHLSRADKETVLRQVAELLVPGGWFVNADLIVADSPELEEPFTANPHRWNCKTRGRRGQPVR